MLHTHTNEAEKCRLERKSNISIQEEVQKVRGLKRKTHKGRKNSEREMDRKLTKGTEPETARAKCQGDCAGFWQSVRRGKQLLMNGKMKGH